MQYKESQNLQRASRRESIVMTAAELFLQQGVEAVSMTQIADASETGVATLYRYFGTKSGVLIESGALLWADLVRLFDGSFATDGYREKSGMAQIEELLDFFILLYENHKPFLRFLREFDLFMQKEKIDPETLAVYESNVLNIYPLFAAAYEKAAAEGSARQGLDAKLMYFSVSHALISTSQKFIEGDVLEADRSGDKAQELRLLIDMALHYLTTSLNSFSQQ